MREKGEIGKREKKEIGEKEEMGEKRDRRK